MRNDSRLVAGVLVVVFLAGGCWGSGDRTGMGGSGGTGGGGGSGPPPPGQLRTAAVAAGKLLGAAVDTTPLSGDATYASVLAREFNYVTPENAMKWGPLAPTATSYNWGPADAVVDFAIANGQ